MKFITIDPGLGGTGYAVFGEGLFPEKTGVLHSKTTGSWAQRQTDIIEGLDDALSYISQLDRAYIELPAFFESNKGVTCATGKDGGDSDLVKLSVMVGRIYEAMLGYDLDIHLIRVNHWKGTLPKKIVSLRIQKRLGLESTGEEVFGDHACDAVGIGLFVKGVFKANEGNNTRKSPAGLRKIGIREVHSGNTKRGN